MGLIDLSVLSLMNSFPEQPQSSRHSQEPSSKEKPSEAPQVKDGVCEEAAGVLFKNSTLEAHMGCTDKHLPA